MTSSEVRNNIANLTKALGEINLNRERYDLKNPTKEDKIILQTATYYKNTFHYPDFSRKLSKAFNFWIQADNKDWERHHELVDLWQTGHLLLNDIAYEKEIRQGKKTAHVVYGVPDTINAFFFSGLALTWVEEKILTKAIEVSNDQTIKISRIRNLLISLRDKLVCPSEDLYMKLCGYRGVLFLLVEEIEGLTELYGKNKDNNYLELATKIRIFVSIIDECKRIATDVGDDLTEGYFSLPIVYTLSNDKDADDVVINVMRQRSTDKALVTLALNTIKQSGCFDYAKSKLRSLKNEIMSQYRRFEKNTLLEEFFEEYLQIPEDFASVTWELS